MKKLLSAMLIVLMVAVVAFPSAALAITTLWISDGSTTLTIVDGSAQDSNPATGWITYIGPVGSSWTFNVTTGVTKPFINNGPYRAAIDVNSIDSTAGGAGTLTIMLNDQDFSLATLPGIMPNSEARMQIGGTMGPGTITYQAYFSNANSSIPPLSGTLIDTLGAYRTGAFSGSAIKYVTASNPFSLTEVLEINHTSSGLTSFNAALDMFPIPLPASVLLLGTGLVGLGLLGWKRSRKES
jgi:hypothetical protein